MTRILIVKTSSLGDVIHNLPVISDIHQHYDNASIDWLVEESFADIPKLHTGVKQVFTVAMRRWRKNLFATKTWREIATFKQHVSAQPYDLIIDTQGLIKSAVMAFHAKGPRHGLDKQSAREPLASYLYHHKHAVARDQHAVVRNRELAAHACGYQKPENLPDYGISVSKRSLNIELPKPFVMGLHGTSKESKLWPTKLWIELAQALATQQLHLLLPWASSAEHIRAQEIAAQSANAVVLPQLRIAQLATIISQAHASVGVDTGLSHLSTALGIPTVAIYTETNPDRTGVYAGTYAPAVNLGGVKQLPAVDAVLDAIKKVTSS